MLSFRFGAVPTFWFRAEAEACPAPYNALVYSTSGVFKVLLMWLPTSMEELNLLGPLVISPPGPLVFFAFVVLSLGRGTFSEEAVAVMMLDLVLSAGSLVSSLRTVPF